MGNPSCPWCCVLFNNLSFFNRLSDDFGDIFDLHLLLGPLPHTFDAIVEHGDTEGAGGGEHFSACRQGLVDASLIDPLPDLLLHPGATAAAAATEAFVAVAPHLRDAITVEHGEHAARLIIHVIVASDVARIVVGKLALVKVFGKFDLLVG